MVILHDVMKTFRMGFCVFLKKEQKPVSFQKKKPVFFFKQQQKFQVD